MVNYGKDYHNAKYQEYRRRNMLFLTGGQEPFCVKCGSTEKLEFDHIDPEGKSFSINRRVSLKTKEMRSELLKCQILCQKCHEEKTAKENSGFTHGTIYGFMKAKCDCAECNFKKRQWHDARNARRRKVRKNL